MDLGTAVVISTLLLMTAASQQETPEQVVNGTSSMAQNNSTDSNCSCPSAAPAATAAPTSTPSRATLAWGLLTVRWDSKCGGDVGLTLYHPSNSSWPVCYQKEKSIQRILGNVCENKSGCEGKPGWHKDSSRAKSGYQITKSGALEKTSCVTLRVQCTVVDQPDSEGQLQSYKVVTALLCCVLLVLFVIRFTRPTVKALQKRLSDRRQNRWIGPTQSHSVSYHRGKTAVRNNDGEKRLSYPALERLAVNDSREPSSNRNSDYNF